jgi:hypothetical protein
VPQRRAALADWAAPVAGVVRRRCGGRLSILRDNIDNGGYRGRHNSARMNEPDGRSDNPVFALAMGFDFSCGKVRALRSAIAFRSRLMTLTRVPISWFAPGGFMDYCWRKSVSFKEGVAAFNEKRVPKLRDDNSQPQTQSICVHVLHRRSPPVSLSFARCCIDSVSNETDVS